MILDKNHDIESQDSYCLETKNYIFFWHGLLFTNAFLSGEESVKELDHLLVTHSIEESVNYLRGQFVCFIYKKSDDNWYAFTDNSGLSYLLYNENTISTSLLGMIKKVGEEPDINVEKVVEFILTGSVYRFETVFDGINLLKPDEIIIFPSMVVRKKVDNSYQIEDPRYRFKQYFCEASDSIKNNRICVDSTGGTDSRIVIALLKYAGLSFETSCVIPGSLELESAQRTADLLNLEFRPVHQQISEQSIESELNEVFEYCDGMSDVLFTHRLWQLDVARRKRNITLTIECSGGELFKDALWWRNAFLSRNTSGFIKKMVMTGKANWDEEKTLPYNLFSVDTRKILQYHKEKTYQYLLSMYGDIDKYLSAHIMFYNYSVAPPRPRQGGIANYLILLEDELVQI